MFVRSRLLSQEFLILVKYQCQYYPFCMKFLPTSPCNSKRRSIVSCLVLLSVALTISVARDGSAQTQAQNDSPATSPAASATASPGSWFTQKEILPGASNGLKLLNIGAAMLIGFLGAAAFYAGVRFGFISNESREQLLSFLKHPPNPKKERLFFYGFGGIVAGVFQWAQPDVLAPIQAFVLGATWPSVVTRIMSGSTPSFPSATSIVNTTPPPKPDEKANGKTAIVVVPRKAAETGDKATTDLKASVEKTAAAENEPSRADEPPAENQPTSENKPAS
jgi:hypothetical protein